MEGQWSQHLTVSTYQRNSWADFLAKALPAALEAAAAADPRYRAGVPPRCLQALGEQHSPGRGDPLASDRAAFSATMASLVQGLCAHVEPAADSAGDFLGAQFVARRLPPPDAAGAAAGRGPEPARVLEAGGSGGLQLKWAEPGTVRVVVEAGPDGEPETQVYHSMENDASRHMAEGEPQPACLVLEGDGYTPALHELLRRAPAWTSAAELGDPPPCDLLQALWEYNIR